MSKENETITNLPLETLLAQAEAGDAKAQFELAESIWATDLKNSIEWYRKAADQKHVKACLALGLIYEKNDRGVEKDDVKAAHYLRIAADKGDSHACYALAKHYEQGTGVEKNEDTAIKYFKKSQEKEASQHLLALLTARAQQGDAAVQFELAETLRQGKHGITKDLKTSAEWYLKAADQKHTGACCILGILHANKNQLLEKDDVNLPYLSPV